MSWSFFQKHIAVILIGAVIFGALTTVARSLVSGRMEGSLGMVLDQMGIDAERFQELQERAARGDEAATEELAKTMEEASRRFEGMGEKQAGKLAANMARMYMRSVIPIFGWSLLLAILALLASTYYLIIAMEDRKDFMGVLSRIPVLFLPLAGVWIWSFVRSFAWIPVVGIVPAIILGPRFILGPVILLKEYKGIMESVRLSYERTQGHWGKIVGNWMVLLLILFVLSVLLGMLLGMVGMSSVWARTIVSSLFQQFGLAFTIVFLVKLSETILANPRRA